MQPLSFVQKIDKKFSKDVERLFYFIKKQNTYSTKIQESVDKYGEPRIIIEDNYILFSLSKINECASLFVLDSPNNDAILLGMLIFFRISEIEIKIIHIAIEEECSLQGIFSKEMVTIRLIEKLIEDCNKLKNLESIILPYTNRKINIKKNFKNNLIK